MTEKSPNARARRKRASVKDVLELLKDFPHIAQAILQIKSLQTRMWEKLEEMDHVLGALAEKPTQKKVPEPSAPFGLSEEDLALVDIIKDPEGRGTVIMPKRYLADKWAPIRDKLEPQGFKWVSAGKKSHWQDWD